MLIHKQNNFVLNRERHAKFENMCKRCCIFLFKSLTFPVSISNFEWFIFMSNIFSFYKDIYNCLRELEKKGPRAKPAYMLKQVELNWNSRSILVDWLVSVSDEYELSHETLHLSVNYIDRFLNSISVVSTLWIISNQQGTDIYSFKWGVSKNKYRKIWSSKLLT